MAEVLTESFCERCGTRYTFESAKPRVKRLTGVKVLSRGLKNFVLSDDSSLDEAMAAARSDTEREVTSQQLDAFHKTFNFCMTCRQYTCANCWNEAAGACLTCSPHLGHEIMPAPFPDLDPLGTTIALGAVDVATGNGASTAGINGNGHAAPAYDAGAWPTSDAWPSHDLVEEAPTAEVATDLDAGDEIDAVARMAALTAIGSSQVQTPDPIEPGPTPEAQALVDADDDARISAPIDLAEDASVEAVAAGGPEPEASSAIAGAAAPEPPEAPAEVAFVADPPTPSPPVAPASPPAPATHDAVAAAAAAQTADLLNRFRPGQSLDAELDAYERERARAADLVTPVAAEVVAADVAPLTAAVAEPEPVAAVEAEVVAVAEPEPVAAVEAEVVAVVEPEPVAAVEAEVVAVVEPEPVAAAEPEVVAAAEPEPVAAAEPEPDRTAEIAAAAAAAATLAAARERPTDVVSQPTWRIVAPDAEPTTPTVAPPPAAPVPSPAPPVPPPAAVAQPQWPTAPQWPEQRASAGLPFLGRPVQPTGGLDSLWAESNREVASAAPAPGRPAAPAGVQPCVSCGLSLSATARFCRRCGTAQHG